MGLSDKTSEVNVVVSLTVSSKFKMDYNQDFRSPKDSSVFEREHSTQLCNLSILNLGSFI